jgi:hypothetical protein
MFTVLLQGCLAGIGGYKILTESPAVNPENAELHEVIVGIRLGVIDGRSSRYLEEHLAKEFSKKMDEEKVFKQTNYPINGTESVVFEVGADSPRREETAGNIAKAVLCGATLLLACMPMTAEYEFHVEVRAIGWPVGTPIGRYRTTGTSRVKFGMLSELEAINKGREAAMTAAFIEVINRIKKDRAKYLPGVTP